MDKLAPLHEVSYKAMMGEFIIYYQGKIVGGKEMLLVDNVDDRAFLVQLLRSMVSELPEPPKKKIKEKK